MAGLRFEFREKQTMSSYRMAINQTTTTIDLRGKYFRNLIVAVVAVSLCSVAWALVGRTLSALTAFLLLVPACGLFFFLDAKLLDDWRTRLLEAWVRRDIDLTAFCDAVRSIRTLPKDTIQGMLASLPDIRDLATEQTISASTREGVVAALKASHASESDSQALKGLASAVVSVSVIVAMVGRDWEPLVGSLAVLLLPPLKSWVRRRRIALSNGRTAAARARSDFSEEKYTELVASLHQETSFRH